MMSFLFLTRVIRPGGGPAGYVYNLEIGLSRLCNSKVKSGDTVRYNFCSYDISVHGNRLTRRLALSSEINVQSADFLKSILNILTLGRWRWLRDILIQVKFMLLNWSSLFSNPKIIVLQGYQSSSLGFLLKLAGKFIVYMPHSPTIASVEYLSTINRPLNSGENLLCRYIYNNEKFLFRVADIVVFPSRNSQIEYLRAYSANIINPQKVRFIASGITFDDANPRNVDPYLDSTQKDSIRVLFAGRYVKDKGFDIFNELAASALSLERILHLSLEFFSIGAGSLIPGPYVKDLGWQENVRQFINYSSLVIIPNRVSYYDLLPLEAASLGKPIIYTPVGGHIDQSLLLPDSLVSKSDNPRDILETLLEMCRILKTDPDYGKKNQLAYQSYFTSEHMTGRWISLLQDFRHD